MSQVVNTPLNELELQVRPSLAPLEAEAKAIEIVDQATYDAATDLAKRAVAARKSIKERFAPGRTAAHAAWKEWVALENQMLEMTTGAERITKAKIGAWINAQERKRAVEEARLAEAARKVEDEAKLLAATEAEAQGAEVKEVEAILDDPTPPPAVVAPQTYQPARGISARETWRGQVVHLGTLIKFVAGNPQFTNLLKVDTAALNALARSQRQLFNVPGAKAVSSTNVAIR